MCSHFTDDVIIADQGFTCDEYAGWLWLPFTSRHAWKEAARQNRYWLEQGVCIHVEQVVGAKQKHAILQSVLAIQIANNDLLYKYNRQNC